MKTVEDRYDGIIIDNVTLPETAEHFGREVELLINSTENKKLLWVKIPIEKSNFIPILTNLGFEFHHCDEGNLMLVKKLVQNSVIPTTKNYMAGVGAIVFRDEKLLVIKDKFSIGYRLPGGQIEKNETIKEAVQREIYEETGVKIEFEAIMSIGHFGNGQFEEANLYITCLAKALTDDITIHDLSEIVDAKWLNIEDFLNSEDTNNFNKSVVRKAVNNGNLKFTEQNIKLRVKNGEVFF